MADTYDPVLDGEFFENPMVQQKGPRPHLEFYTESVQNHGKSEAEGRAIFDLRDRVMITNPGSRDVTIAECKDKIKQDPFIAWAYKRWKATQEQVTDGTPLETVPWLNKAQVSELRFLNIHSLEALANLPDTAKQKFHGALDLSRKAQAYIQAAKDTAVATKLQDQVSAQDAIIADLQRQLKEMNGQFEQKLKKASGG